MQFDDYVTAYRRRTMSHVFLAKKKLSSRRERRYGWTDYRSSFKKSYRASALHVTRLTRMTRSRALYTPVKSDGYCIAWSISDRARVSHFYTRHVRRYCIREGGELRIPVTKINAESKFEYENRDRLFHGFTDEGYKKSLLFTQIILLHFRRRGIHVCFIFFL